MVTTGFMLVSSRPKSW